ncbi:MAG: RsmE family RNA methyltransferase [Candidatus Cloacimonetes bacterium]|nr:RsmE family RNA methyltransferase [Candidatus Cloacimonadota bacterium]
MPSFYTPDMKINDDIVSISGTEHHHICHVFRRKEGDKIILSNGKGLLAEGIIRNVKKKELTVSINKITAMQISQPQIAVAFPLLKNKHDNMIIEKLTELGVKDFFPITTERTIRKSSINAVEKFQKVAIAAMKQCDNAFLPQIHEVQSLNELIEKMEEFVPIAALEIGKHKTINELVTNLEVRSICIIIGPEGGFDKGEIEYLQNKQVATFTLGNHILRAETAAIASVAQLVGYFLRNNSEYY